MEINYAYQKASRIIALLLQRKKPMFLIYPYGISGHLVKSILNFDFNVNEIACISDMDEENVIFSSNPSYDRSDVTVLLTIDNKTDEEQISEYRHQIMQKYHISQIVDIFSPSVYFDSDVLNDESFYTNNRKVFMEACSRELYANDVQGSIAECGVYEGDSAVILNELFPDRKLYLFDTFNGYDSKDMTDQEYSSWGEYMMICHNRFKVTPTLEALMSRMPWREQVNIIKGHFPDTILNRSDINNEKFALVNLDMNLYLPMKAGLDFFWPRLSNGGILLVDDIRHRGLPSARKALNEFCTKNHLSYTTITYNGMGMAAITKNYNI